MKREKINKKILEICVYTFAPTTDNSAAVSVRTKSHHHRHGIIFIVERVMKTVCIACNTSMQSQSINNQMNTHTHTHGSMNAATATAFNKRNETKRAREGDDENTKKTHSTYLMRLVINSRMQTQTHHGGLNKKCGHSCVYSTTAQDPLINKCACYGGRKKYVFNSI